MNWNTLNCLNAKTKFTETFSLYFTALIMVHVCEYNSILAQNKSSTQIFDGNQTYSVKEKYPHWLKLIYMTISLVAESFVLLHIFCSRHCNYKTLTAQQ